MTGFLNGVFEEVERPTLNVDHIIHGLDPGVNERE